MMGVESIKNWVLVAAFCLLAIGMTQSGGSVDLKKGTSIFYNQPETDGEISKTDKVISVREAASGEFSVQFRNIHRVVENVPKSGRWVLRKLKFSLPQGACRFVTTTPQTFNCSAANQNSAIGHAKIGKVKVSLLSVRSGIYKGGLLTSEGSFGSDEVYVTEFVIGLGGAAHYTERIYSDPNTVFKSQGDQTLLADQSR